MGKVVSLDARRLRRDNVVVVNARLMLITYVDDRLVGAGYVDSDEDDECRPLTCDEARALGALLVKLADDGDAG